MTPLMVNGLPNTLPSLPPLQRKRLAAWHALSNVQLCCIWETYVNKYFEGLLHWGKKVLLGK